MELLPHQSSALKRLKNGSVLWGPVGSGKSRVAVEYYLLEEIPHDVYVITTAKKRDDADWLREFANFGIGMFHDETVGGVLTVDSWNNINQYKDVTNAFFIFDEQRVVGRGKWVKAFLRIARRNRWIMLSATPGDTWLDYIPLFVANGFYKSRRDFEARHVMWKPYIKYPVVERYVDVNQLIKHRNDILVRMRFNRETIRHSEKVYCEHDQELWETVTKQRWNPFLDRPIRDASELYSLMRRVVNSDASRVKAVKALLRQFPRLIVFYNFNYELEALRGLNELRTVAEYNGHKHEDIPDTEKWVYLVQYVAGSEGWNCISTNSMCFYSLTPSYKKWEQAHGRIDRLNTPFTDLYFATLFSKTAIDAAMWRSLKAKQDFNFATDFPLKMLEWN